MWACLVEIYPLTITCAILCHSRYHMSTFPAIRACAASVSCVLKKEKKGNERNFMVQWMNLHQNNNGCDYTPSASGSYGWQSDEILVD